MSDQDQQKAAAVEMEASGRGGLSQEELDAIVASADTGGRAASGPVGMFIMLVALAWSLFQLWYASPLPFVLRFGVLNDTEARSIHLAFALFLAFLACPAFKASPRAFSSSCCHAAACRICGGSRDCQSPQPSQQA